MKNMGVIDRVVRALLAVTVLVLYLLNMISGTAAIILGVIAVVFLATSMIGICPAYMPFGIKTFKSEGK